MENLDIYTNVMRIDLGAVSYNYSVLRDYILNKNNGSEAGVVLKSNAYGIGLREVGPVVYNAGARKFFVMWIGEAIDLQKVLGKDACVYVLSGALPDTEEIFHKNKIIPVLSNEVQLVRWLDYAKKVGEKLPCIIKFDTGMNRMGIKDTNTDIIKNLQVEQYLDVHYIMSHMYSAHLLDSEMNKAQLARIDAVKKSLPQFKTSFSNTYSMFLNHEQSPDLFRIGRGLYGLFDRLLNKSNYPQLTKCAISVDVRVVQVKEVKKGEKISYGATYTFESDSRVATLGIGYSHGLPSVLSNKGHLMINGKPARIIGSITMEYIMIDVTDHEGIAPESWIHVMSNEGEADDLANTAGMTSLEIMSAFGKGIQKKIYYNSFGCMG